LPRPTRLRQESRGCGGFSERLAAFKLYFSVISVTVPNAYSLEYGVDEMEMRRDAVKPGERGRRRADGD